MSISSPALSPGGSSCRHHPGVLWLPAGFGQRGPHRKERGPGQTHCPAHPFPRGPPDLCSLLTPLRLKDSHVPLLVYVSGPAAPPLVSLLNAPTISPGGRCCRFPDRCIILLEGPPMRVIVSPHPFLLLAGQSFLTGPHPALPGLGDLEVTPTEQQGHRETKQPTSNHSLTCCSPSFTLSEDQTRNVCTLAPKSTAISDEEMQIW